MQAQHAPRRHEELCVPRGNSVQVATGPTGHGHCDIGRRAKGRSALAHQQHRRKLQGVDAHKAVHRGVVERRARKGDGAVQRGVGQLEGLAAAGEELGGEQAGIGQGGAFVSGGGVGRRGARDDSRRGRELDCGVCSLLRGWGGWRRAEGCACGNQAQKVAGRRANLQLQYHMGTPVDWAKHRVDQRCCWRSGPR